MNHSFGARHMCCARWQRCQRDLHLLQFNQQIRTLCRLLPNRPNRSLLSSGAALPGFLDGIWDCKLGCRHLGCEAAYANCRRWVDDQILWLLRYHEREAQTMFMRLLKPLASLPFEFQYRKTRQKDTPGISALKLAAIQETLQSCLSDTLASNT